MSRQYTAFTKEFKLEALRLAEQPNTCIAHLARDLGIRRNMIYKWREQLQVKQDKAFKRTATDKRTEYHKATHAELLKQNKILQKELDSSRMEVDILKKAKTYFEAEKN
jgi:transposase